MKKLSILSLVFVAFLVFGSFSHDSSLNTPSILKKTVSLSTHQQKEVLYFVISDSVPMYSGPGSNYNIVAKLKKESQVAVIDKKFGDWYTIKYHTTNGFINKKNLKAVEMNTHTED